jgi:hypothetical protein
MSRKKRKANTITVPLDFACRLCGAKPEQALLVGRRLIHECVNKVECAERARKRATLG